MKQNEQSENGHKRFLFVKKRLKRAAALAGILIIALSLSGCKNFVETDVGAETKITNQTISETTNAKTLTDKKNEFATEPMTRDELFEEMLCDVEINGQKLSLPCSSKDLCLNNDLGIEPYKECPVYYDDDDNMYHYIFRNPINEHMSIRAEYCSDKSNEAELDTDKMYAFYVSVYSEENNDDYRFRFGQVNNYSYITQNYIESMLGKPSKELLTTSSYELDNSRIITILYDKNSYVKSVSCHWV